MSAKTTILARFKSSVFYGKNYCLRRMRTWFLACITAALLLIWWVLAIFSTLHPPEFWHAFIGANPVRDLGPNGAIMLALYIPGALAFYIVSVCLVAVGDVWKARLLPLK